MQFKWQAASDTVVAWCCQRSWSRIVIFQASGSHLPPVLICPLSLVYLLEVKSNVKKFGYSALNFGAFTNYA